MRKTRNQQLPLAEATADHPKAKELLKISEILDSNDSIYDLALQDFGISDNDVGANGMTAEQVIRAAIIKMKFPVILYLSKLEFLKPPCAAAF